MQFEWNSKKAQVNHQKHGVRFEEAMTAFYDVNQIAFYDPEHSEHEDRELLIGHNEQGRLLLVSYTLRADTIRLISARKATHQESQVYANGI